MIINFAGGRLRLYNAGDFFFRLRQNTWIFLTAIAGNPGLDPDQEGDVYQFSARQTIQLLAGVLLIPWLTYCSGFWPVLVWLCSPWLISATCELGEEKHPTGRIYRSPKIWLPRWYAGVLGIVLLFAGMPAGIRWAIAGYWMMQTFAVARCYSSPLLFYQTVKNENPNRNHFRLAGLPYLMLEAGKHYQAEMEFQEVLKVDPLNWKAQFILAMFQKNREWTAAGIGFLSFRCSSCELESARLLKHGDRLSFPEHQMYFLRVCARCGAFSGVLSGV